MGEKSGGRLCNIAKYFAIQKKVKKNIIRGRTHQKRVGIGNARCKGKGGGGWIILRHTPLPPNAKKKK